MDVLFLMVGADFHPAGKQARDEVNQYLLSESEPSPEDGYAVSAAMVQLLNERPDNPQATTGTVEFEVALATSRPPRARESRRRRTHRSCTAFSDLSRA